MKLYKSSFKVIKIIGKIIGGSYFFSYALRPKSSEDVKLNIYDLNKQESDYSNCAIIIQGQVSDYDFVYQTILLYKKLFKNINIYLSTWLGELSSGQLTQINSLKINLIESDVLQNSGYKNINSQIKSTVAAIECCKKNGIKYILKTRTDQRFYNVNTIKYLVNYYIYFNLNSNGIIGCSLNTFKQRLYCISDMFLFGESTAMYNFWHVPYDMRPSEYLSIQLKSISSHHEYSKLNICEQYLVTNYLEKCGEQIIWEENHSNKLLAKYFAIIDQSSIDLIWQKYSLKENMWRNYDGNNLSELSFSDWLINYVNFKN